MKVFDGKTIDMINEYEKSGYAPSYFSLLRNTAFPMTVVLEMEEKFGKPFVEWGLDEAKEFVMETKFGPPDKNGLRRCITPRSYTQRKCVYRDFCNWYSDNYHPVPNPWTRKELNGIRGDKWLFEDKNDKIELSIFKEVIDFTHSHYEGDYAIYRECLFTMLHEGFPKLEDIVLLKEKDIDFETGDIRIASGTTIHVSQECINLMKQVHNMTMFTGVTIRKLYAIPYRDGYFHICSSKDNIDDREASYVSSIMNGIFKQLRGELQKDVTSRILYVTGFIDYCIKRIGKEQFRNCVEHSRDKEANAILEQMISDYGFISDHLGNFRRVMLNYNLQ